MKNCIRPIAHAGFGARLFAGAALLLSLFALGCNTVEGVGEDVESVGEATSEASRDVRR
jgi:predicted small secreted protein